MSSIEWQRATLSSISLAIKDGSHGSHKRVAKGVPLLSAKNVAESGRLEWDDLDEQVSEEEYSAICRLFTPLDNDLLLTIVGTLGRRALFNGDRVAFQRSVAFVRADSRKVAPRYLYHAVDTHDFRQQLLRRSNATAQAGLYLGALGQTTIPIPALDQQCAIAAVIDAVDEEIAVSEAIIAKRQQVRDGLLHDLLTCGINEDGKIRDSEAFPEEFKESRLGRIPMDWNIQTLNSALAETFDYRGRTPLKIGLAWGGGDIPALSANNVEMGRVNFDKEAYLGSPELYKRWMTQGDTEEGDVLITMEAPLGNIAQIPDSRRYILSQRVVLLRPNPELLVKSFLALQMMAGRFQRELVRNSTGSTAVGIQRAKLETIEIAVPRRLEEQQCIADTMRAVNDQILSEIGEHKKLVALKEGLIADLLTGRVRVPDDLKIEALA